MNNERIEEIKKYAEAEVVLSYPFNIFSEYCLDLIETIEQQQKEITKLKCEVQGWKSQVRTAQGWYD